MKAVIVLGGDKPGPSLLINEAGKADITIAADSGLHAFEGTGIEPDIVMGDMDSIDLAVLEKYTKSGGTTQVLPSVKDDTDGVAALDYALSLGASEIVILGALGGRMDHALANCMLLVRAAGKGANAVIVSDTQDIYLVRGKQTFSGKKGSILSLLSLGDARIRKLEGLYYPLEDYDMKSDYPIGISNVFLGECATVDVAYGDVLCFIEK